MRAKARMLERVGGHPPERRERRPEEAGWSMSDVVEHLVLAEAGMAAALAKEPSPERPRVLAPWYRFLGLRLALVADFRIRAPVESILPRREMSWGDLVGRWEAERTRLGSWLEEVDPAKHASPRFKHPITGWMTVPQALTFAGDHLHHHLMQIGRIERRLGVR
ncbi:MAG TPA: DinB family protein [Gemmatimonadales bacterium]|nr:DinB family protein [Gemmatimonadales bacterium]